jgi:hypothetical protein
MENKENSTKVVGFDLDFWINEIERQVREGKSLCQACDDIKKIIAALKKGENVVLHCTNKELKIQKYRISKLK